MHHLHTVFIVSSSLTVTTNINIRMLKYEYTDDWRLIAKLSIDFPFTQQEVYTALEKEQYYGDEDRTYCPNPSSPILNEILDIVKTNIPNLL